MTLRMRGMQLVDLIKGLGLGQREKSEAVDSRNGVQGIEWEAKTIRRKVFLRYERV